MTFFTGFKRTTVQEVRFCMGYGAPHDRGTAVPFFGQNIFDRRGSSTEEPLNHCTLTSGLDLNNTRGRFYVLFPSAAFWTAAVAVVTIVFPSLPRRLPPFSPIMQPVAPVV